MSNLFHQSKQEKYICASALCVPLLKLKLLTDLPHPSEILDFGGKCSLAYNMLWICECINRLLWKKMERQLGRKMELAGQKHRVSHLLDPPLGGGIMRPGLPGLVVLDLQG